MISFELLKQHLSEPEYLHVLLNPLPVYGLFLGAVALAIAIASRSRAAHVTALAIIFLSAGSAWPVKILGERGYDRVESLSSKAGYEWLDAHAQRATRFIFVFYIVAAVAGLALVVPWKFPRTSLPFSWATLLLTLVACGVGGWIAFAGGQVRHSEFRSGSPPEKAGDYEKMRE